MKKIIALCVCTALCFALVGCGGRAEGEGQEAEVLSIDEFLDKYKRENIDTVSEDPSTFLFHIAGLTSDTQSDLSEWDPSLDMSKPTTVDGKTLLTAGQLETILFNMPAHISVYFINENGNSAVDLLEEKATNRDEDSINSVNVIFEAENNDENFSGAVALCEYLFQTYDDAEKITVRDLSLFSEESEIDEGTLRQIFQQEDTEQPFECVWEYETEDGESQYISIEYYASVSLIDEAGYSSWVSVTVDKS